MTALPYMTHCFELSNDAGDIRITVERAGDPVELTIGTSSWVLPPGLCIAMGKMLAAAGHSSIDGKRRQAARSEEAARVNVSQADEDAAAFREHRLAVAAAATGEE